MAEDTVKVDLTGTFGKNGVLYGPGKGIEVPASLARALRLTKPKSEAKAAKKAKGKK